MTNTSTQSFTINLKYAAWLSSYAAYFYECGQQNACDWEDFKELNEEPFETLDSIAERATMMLADTGIQLTLAAADVAQKLFLVTAEVYANEQLYALATTGYLSYVGPVPTYTESAAKVYLDDLQVLDCVEHIQFLESPLIGWEHPYGMFTISRNLIPDTNEPGDSFTIGIGTRDVTCPADQLSEHGCNCPESAFLSAEEWADEALEALSEDEPADTINPQT